MGLADLFREQLSSGSVCKAVSMESAGSFRSPQEEAGWEALFFASEDTERSRSLQDLTDPALPKFRVNGYIEIAAEYNAEKASTLQTSRSMRTAMGLRR